MNSWSTTFVVCAIVAVLAATYGYARGQQRPGDPVEPIIVEVGYTPDLPRNAVGPIEETACDPMTVSVTHMGLRYCLVPPMTLVLAEGCE